MHPGAGMMCEQHADRGIERILGESAPLQAFGHGAEGMDLPAVPDEQVPRREIRHSEVLRGVDLEALVHDECVPDAERAHGARAWMVRIGELTYGAYHDVRPIRLVRFSGNLDVLERHRLGHLDAAGRHVGYLVVRGALGNRAHQAKYLLVGRRAHCGTDPTPAAFGNSVDNEPTLAGAGVIGVVGFGILTFVGEHLAGTGSNAAKLTAVYAMALMELWELAGLIQAASIPGLLKLALVIAAYAGLALMISGGGISGLFSLRSMPAGALVLSGTACWMWYTVLFRKFQAWSVLKFSAITFLLGTAAFALIDAIAIGAHVLPAPSIDAILAGSPAYLYLGILAGAVPLILWNRSARVITPVNALMFMSVGTAVTVVIADHMSGYRQNGAAMIVGGIAMIFAIGVYSALQYRSGLKPRPSVERTGRQRCTAAHSTPTAESLFR